MDEQLQARLEEIEQRIGGTWRRFASRSGKSSRSSKRPSASTSAGRNNHGPGGGFCRVRPPDRRAWVVKGCLVGDWGGLPLGGELTAMPAWLIPYWIADLLVTLGLLLIGLGSAGLALIWLRTRLGGAISKASLRSGRPIRTRCASARNASETVWTL